MRLSRTTPMHSHSREGIRDQNQCFPFYSQASAPAFSVIPLTDNENHALSVTSNGILKWKTEKHTYATPTDNNWVKKKLCEVQKAVSEMRKRTIWNLRKGMWKDMCTFSKAGNVLIKVQGTCLNLSNFPVLRKSESSCIPFCPVDNTVTTKRKGA